MAAFGAVKAGAGPRGEHPLATLENLARMHEVYGFTLSYNEITKVAHIHGRAVAGGGPRRER